MRPRKKNRHLPACMYHRHGAYYLVRKGRWIRLGTELAPALQEYARRTEPKSGVGELIDRILEDAEERVKPRTMEQYRIAAAKIRPAFVEFSPEQVRPQHIAQFMDHYRRTPNMANRCRTILKMAFDHAVQMGICDANPVISIPRHQERKRDRYLTDDEYQRIYAVASPVLRCIMDLAYLTAQRIGDVLAIKREDITDDGIMFRQEKTGRRLLVESTPQLDDAIRRAKALHGHTPKLLLLAQRNGKPRSYRGVRDLFDRYARKAGVEDAHLHDLRAKSVTDAKAQGHNPTDLAGHTTEAQTVRYIRSRETTIVRGPSLRNTARVFDSQK